MSGEARERLIRLEQSPLAWVDLVDAHGGSIACAAHDLASTRLACRYTYPLPPTAVDVWAAAQEIAARVTWTGSIPTARTLAADCRAAGLLVMGMED